MKYIDSEKLIAEIEGLKESYHPYLSEFENGCREGRNNVLDDIHSFITSLQLDHLPDAGKMVEQEHIADVSKMMEQQEVDDASKKIRKDIKEMADSFKQVIFIAESYGNSYIKWDTKSTETAIELLERATEYLRNARKEE